MGDTFHVIFVTFYHVIHFESHSLWLRLFTKLTKNHPKSYRVYAYKLGQLRKMEVIAKTVDSLLVEHGSEEALWAFRRDILEPLEAYLLRTEKGRGT